MYSVAELARITRQPYMTVFNQMKRGWCAWPKREMKAQSKDPAYKCWENMIQRCTNPKFTDYKNYGGRGIKLSPEFISFKKFIEHIGPRPSRYHSINRINNNGNYEPGNVEWATPAEQANNKRCHRYKGSGIERHGNWYRFVYQGEIQKYRTFEEAAEAKDNLYGKGHW